MTASSKIILGIDPGTIVLGYAVIKVGGSVIQLMSMGVVHLNRYEDGLQRLKIIYEKISGLVNEYRPDACAVEAPFYGKNVQSMLKLGRAQGVAIASVLTSGVEVHEFMPKRIKQSITGNGNASKEQVAAMLQQIIGFEMQPRFLDATDALAAAVCYHFQNKVTGSDKAARVSGWKDYIRKNPGRIK
ncbi:MAG: crossover junction endodeoxyribonuclease RuvC [Chitinophagales bacterium]|nr:crossover junction endodeoxyribonuclease RuvC [Chitinophagales bacterium]MDW8418867.1 crossover junction endodeoxyribonuclease RuvC [Chitinophagales bacterium]